MLSVSLKLLCLLVVLLVGFACASDPARLEFEPWVRLHNKTYSSVQEHEHRLAIFKANMKHISDLNAKHQGELTPSIKM